ncbi:prolyl oligopeptidase family serine peptidase [Marinobacterium sp. CAU 1594]|nr:prolyl oligopeptidase family serine peptidase [Marinobacterium arenosum]
MADLNYRGSTGYGRAYRLRLKHNWGVTDVADAAALIDHLAEQRLIDPQQVFIRGHSAGGFTTLAALAGHDRFRAGASLYGVSDLLKLREHTHKFESRYLDWLIGTPQQQAEHYSQRSPLNSADRIRCPVIFFQGMDDPVVPLQQTEAMVAALKANGVEVSYHLFVGEQHGFRKPQNQQLVLEEELAFYRRALDNG